MTEKIDSKMVEDFLKKMQEDVHEEQQEKSRLEGWTWVTHDRAFQVEKRGSTVIRHDDGKTVGKVRYFASFRLFDLGIGPIPLKAKEKEAAELEATLLLFDRKNLMPDGRKFEDLSGGLLSKIVSSLAEGSGKPLKSIDPEKE